MRGKSEQKPETKAAPAAGRASVKNIVAALMQAAHSGNVEEVNNLAAKLTPQQIDKTNAKGNNALMIAAAKGNVAVVEALIEQKADINIANNDGKNALMFAAQIGNVAVVKMLLDKGANINALTDDGSTALTFAAQIGKGEVVKMLLDPKRQLNPEQINHANNNGFTALMFAVQGGNVNLVQTLLDNGANINALTHDGTTALMIAAEKGRLSVVQMLAGRLSAEQIDHANNNGSTALMFAVQSGKLSVVRILANKLSAEQIDHKNSNGKTARDLAVAQGKGAVVEILDEILAEKRRAAAINQVPEKSHSQNPVENEDEKDPGAGIIVSTPANKSKIEVEIEDQPGMDLKYIVRQALSQITDAIEKAGKAADSLEGIHLSPEEEKSLADALENAQAMVKKLLALQKGAAGQGLQGFANPNAPHAAADPGRNQQPVGPHKQSIVAARSAIENAPAAAAAVNPVMEGPGLEEDNGPPGAAAGQGLQGFANQNAPLAAAAPGPDQQQVHEQRPLLRVDSGPTSHAAATGHVLQRFAEKAIASRNAPAPAANRR
jgi:ankyrin repeat protein